LRTVVSGELMQEGNTRDLVFSIIDPMCICHPA
jgi:2-keto-4-pentenoate hydratase/2-oxohepta-3-ene-1,7-dioic acid hydratase in catechol pathway